MKDMLQEMIEKRLFVENELSAMLRRACRGDWFVGLTYAFDGANEIVTVMYSLNDGRHETDVNVTADSRWAIAKDVMKAVAELYE